MNDAISKPRTIVGIDPGIVHLGLAWVDFDRDNHHKPMICKGASCVNLTEACNPSFHHTVPYSLCKLGHSNHLHDRISHFFQEWNDMFETAEVILVEAQPFKSAGYPFELMMRQVWGSKCTFVAPQTLHAYFGTAKLSYDDRKFKNEDIVEAWLETHGASTLWEQIKTERRQHDCADAFLLIKHYLDPMLCASKPIEPNIVTKSRFFDSFCASHRHHEHEHDDNKNDNKNNMADFRSFLETFRYKGD